MKALDPGVLLGMFIEWPWLAFLVAAPFAYAFARWRTKLAFAAALAWSAYALYESGMKHRVLCSGECNIRVDLLLAYPILAVLTVSAIVGWWRAARRDIPR